MPSGEGVDTSIDPGVRELRGVIQVGVAPKELTQLTGITPPPQSIDRSQHPGYGVESRDDQGWGEWDGQPSDYFLVTKAGETYLMFLSTSEPTRNTL
jgi:hypothetical protein